MNQSYMLMFVFGFFTGLVAVGWFIVFLSRYREVQFKKLENSTWVDKRFGMVEDYPK